MKKRSSRKRASGIRQSHEPETAYTAGKLGAIFKTVTLASPEEMENDTRRYSAGLSPLQRLAYLHELNRIAFGHILNQHTADELWDKTIHIKEAK